MCLFLSQNGRCRLQKKCHGVSEKTGRGGGRDSVDWVMVNIFPFDSSGENRNIHCGVGTFSDFIFL